MNDTTTYTIRVKSLLDAHWSPRLADLVIIHNTDGTTTLTGPLADQAQLHGVLTTLRDMNAVLLDLQATSSTSERRRWHDAKHPSEKGDGP